MQYFKLLFLISIVLLGCSSSRNFQLSPNQSIILDSTKAYETVRQCSRYAPTIEGSWNPSAKQIKELESLLYKVYDLKAVECCLIGVEIIDLNEFYRQYAGIIVDGKKLIYVNAFSKHSFDYSSRLEKFDWKKEPYVVCDGGEFYWGVCYDPITKEFIDLAFNGVA